MTESHAGDEERGEVTRWYTRARRFPQLIGQTPDGTKLPGGPYTVTQVVGLGIFLFVASRTTALWGQLGMLPGIVLLAGLAFALVFGLGKLPIAGRNPLSVVMGLWQALFSPAFGRMSGKPVRPRKSHRVQHSMVLHLPVEDAVPSLKQKRRTKRRQAPASSRPRRYHAPTTPSAPIWSRRRRSEVTGPLTEDNAISAHSPTSPPPQVTSPAPQLTNVQRLLASTPPTRDQENL